MFLILILVFIPLSQSFVDVNSRVDCYPEPGASQQACLQRKCNWDVPTGTYPINTPYCYYPRESGFTLAQRNGNVYTLASGFPNAYGDNISPLTLTTSTIGSNLLISIGTPARYVPPLNIPKTPSSSTESLTFNSVNIPGTNFFAFKISRTSNGAILWDTTIGGMQFTDKFIQISTFLPTSNLFGFGDHVHQRLKHDLSRYTVWPMFARDIGPDSGSALSTQNLYGVHPFYICMENDGKAHGVFILNSNAQEVETGPGPHIVYRTIGGQLDITFFPGPKPEDVVMQYMNHIGTPFLPAYWALGFQLCRWGYANLADMQTVVGRVQAAGIPLDVPYADIDYMNHDEDFTEGSDWAGFPQYAQQLHSQGLHLILIFDPAIEADYDTFQRAITQGVSFIEWATDGQVPHSIQDQYPFAKNTRIMLGNVWPDRNTAFPDFLDTTNVTNQWWINEFIRFHQTLAFDGIWIDMNEPSNFDTDTYNSPSVLPATSHLSCPIGGSDGTFDYPPYQTYAVFNRPGEYLCSKTLCMLGKTARRSMNFYDTKNLYGWSEARATYQALRGATGKRGAVISRSTFPSSGRYGGHWLGDNTARWADLKTSIIGAMEFNFFGIPYVGSDICGFNGDTTEELCLRWHQMGAFHSFSRNHNTRGAPPQDPAEWPSVALAAKIALSFRYQYLPYLYTLHYRSSLSGNTVVRPLFFEFPTDVTTQTIDHQFMWGSSLMISPATDPGVTSVNVYFPNAIWYSLIPESYGNVLTPGTHSIPALTTSLTPVHVKAGSIIPRQAPNVTTTISRKNPFELLVTFSVINQTNTGEMFYDAGDDIVDDIRTHPRHHWTFSFQATTKTSFVSGNCDGCTNKIISPTLDVIEVLGMPFSPQFNSFKLNGNPINVNVQSSRYSAITKILYIKTSGLINLNNYIGGQNFILTWNNNPQ